MRNIRIYIYLLLVATFAPPLTGAQLSNQDGRINIIPANDSTSYRDTGASILPAPPFPAPSSDSLAADSVKRPKNALDAIVDYDASDSIVFTAGNWGYLYGQAEVKYKDIQLKAENISMSMDSSIVHATFAIDSLGQEFGYPVFSDGGSEYEAKGMSYNFKTKKGYVTHVITEQGEGYVVGDQAKKNEDGSFFMGGGKYTTCDDHEHPHFYLALTKARVRPKKNIVVGPAYLVIEDLPLYPIGIPFGFFPFTDKYSSGVIMPSYADELDRGFGLRDGGYYFAINDYIDLAVRGEIYTKGSWGLSGNSTYRKRYRYSGSFNFSYLYTKIGDKEDPDYSVSKDFRLTWSHSQDAKANMYRTLSANVNYSTSSYNRNQLNEIYSGDYTTNTKSSTVTMTQRFPNSPFTLSANINASQISRDTTVSLTLPNLTVTMSRIYPFKRKEMVGAERWYEKIQMSYSGDFRNSITTKEYKLLKSSLIKDWKNAMKHSIPVSATFNIFNYLNITPTFNYTERWYTQKIHRGWDAERRQHVNTDTTYSFNRVYDFNYALSFQTKVYGFFEPLFKIPWVGGNHIQKIRHVFTPSISFNGRPDFGEDHWGYYETYSYLDANGNKQTATYSPYAQGIFGVPGTGKSGNISFSFENNLEMKVGADSDSSKVVSLIDNMGIRFSYNMMADSLKWSDISASLRLKLSKSLTINVNATFDPYMYAPVYTTNPNTGEQTLSRLNKVDKLRIGNGKGFGRLRSTGYSISPSINQDTFKKWFGKDEESKSKSDENSSETPEKDDNGNPDDNGGNSRLAKKKDTGEYDEDGYLKNEVKWNLSASYSFNYAYSSDIDPKIMEYKRRLTHNMGLSGSIQPTKNWSLNFTTSYDFDNRKFAYLNCSLTRNLHCFTLSASFIPVGPYQSYFVSLSANSTMLRDLKYDQRGRTSSFDPEWY
ncbi:MAG: LPS-assembly protein LptD [Prevotella sp.]|nr:LPS-assembly protein LptD [Prevotella sp.]